MDDYLHDMRITQAFAELNRRAIANDIIKGMKLDVEEIISTIHNYIDLDSMILRKGAVSAKAGEKLIIPMNMRRRLSALHRKGQSGLERICSPRCRSPDEPHRCPEQFYLVTVQERDERHLYHFGQPEYVGRKPDGLQADGIYRPTDRTDCDHSGTHKTNL